MAKQDSGSGQLRFAPIALRLAYFRRINGEMSQAALGDLIDYSDATIVRVEAGQQNWNQEFLQRCAKAFNISVLELFELENDSFFSIYLSLSEGDRLRAKRLLLTLKEDAA